MRIAFFLLWACALVSLSGCGVRTAYNNLDWLTVRWVNQQVSLNPDQEQKLRDFLDQELVWHCATQLLDYQDLVEDIRLDLMAHRLDRDRLASHGQAIADFGRTLTERSLPILTDLAVSMDDEQIEQLLAAFSERTDKVRLSVEQKSLDDLAEDRLASMQRTLRRFMGRTNAAQSERLAVWANSVTATESYQLRQRLYWQDRLAAALERRQDRPFIEQEIAALLRPESAWSDDYRRVMEANRTLTLQALEEVFEAADTRQLNRLSARLSSLRSDFQQLSCEGRTPPAVLAGASSS